MPRLITWPLVAMLAASAAGIATANAAAPPANTVAQVESLANFNGADVHTAVFADPTNDLLFAHNEFPGPAQCTSGGQAWVAYSAMTLRKITAGCLPYAVIEGSNSGAGHNNNVLVAVDSADGLLLVPQQGTSTVVAIDEASLTVRYQWQLPTQIVASGSITGMSWSAATDELTVVMPSGAGQVQIADVGIPAARKQSGSATTAVSLSASAVRWEVVVPQCYGALAANLGTAAPYLSPGDTFALVPCQLPETAVGGSIQGHEIDGVVKVDLADCGLNATPAPLQCPATTAVAPTPITALIYDLVSGRAILPNLSSTGLTLDVLDSKPASASTSPTFIGSFDGDDPCGCYSSLAFNSEIGRLYITTVNRMTAVDLRRSPFAPGSVFDQYAGAGYDLLLPALPPDAMHPYPRFMVGYAKNGALPSFSIFADTIPVSQDPPPGNVDENTDSTPGSAPTTATSVGAASGYGLHSDDVGGPGAAIINNDSNEFSADRSRFIGGTRDLASGWVKGVTLGGGMSQADASSFGDENGATANDYQVCSDITSASNCQPPPAAPPTSLPSPPSGTSTAQPWPFPDAECEQPGVGAPHASVSGFYWSGSTTNGVTATLGPANVNDQTASVDCSATPPFGGVTRPDSAVGQAASEAFTVAANGLPGVSVGSATSVASVQPPTDSQGVLTQVVSDARDIRIDLPGHTLQIGEVKQTATATATGLQGGASAIDVIAISNVMLDGSELCGQCTPTSLSQINNTLPGLIDVIVPPAAAPFGTSGTTINGSPGGYQAVVEADVLEQQGDRDFNQMTASEAVAHPALRIVLYQNSSYETNREVLDFAGAEADAEQGVHVQNAPFAFFPPPQTPDNQQVERQLAGVPSTGTPTPPDTPSGMPTGNAVAAQPTGVVEQFLTGVSYLVRSPIAALRMLTFLGVLGLPLVLMWRRRQSVAAGAFE